MNKRETLPLGKLPHSILKDIFRSYTSPEIMKQLNTTNSNIMENYIKAKNRVELGFSIGEDAALIDFGDRYLVSKTDPITFTTDEIGYYVVNVNANDIASMGATPKWFSATILLPESKTTPDIAKGICLDIQKACLKQGIVLTGGHTEVTFGLERPIVIGSLLGEVSKDKYVKTSGGKPGDALIVTKGIPLEGVSIIAREKEDELRQREFSEDFIQKCKNMLHSPGISVVKEAILAVNNFHIHSMHDPTEGGLAMGVVEMAKACECGVKIDFETIPFIPEGQILCNHYGLDPLGVISSGSLLISLPKTESKRLVQLFSEHNINAAVIGELIEEKEYKIIINNTEESLKFSEKDELTKIF